MQRILVLCVLAQLPWVAAWAQRTEGDGSIRCVRLSTIDRTEIIDDQTIAFYLRNGDIYVNELDRSCPGLDRGRPFGYQTSTGRLCDVDVITILDNFDSALTEGPTCRLGPFAPADEETIALLTGDEEPAEVTVVEIEVEDDQAGADAVAAARACSDITDDAERLACLDAALGELPATAEESPDLAPHEPDSVQQPPARVAEEPSTEPTETERTIRVIEVSRNDFGITTFVAESGERWVQSSPARGRYPPAPFDAVLLPAMQDTYFLVSPLGGPRVRVSTGQ